MAGGEDDPVDAGDRTAEGLAHLQAAAREMIAAARVLLDVAEDLVEDPGAVNVVVDAVGSVVRSAARAGRNVAGQARPAGPSTPGRDDDGVQHIRVG